MVNKPGWLPGKSLQIEPTVRVTATSVCPPLWRIFGDARSALLVESQQIEVTPRWLLRLQRASG